MADLLDLQDQYKHKVYSAQDILKKAESENRVMDQQEQDDSDKLIAESEAIQTEIESIKTAEAKADRIRDAVRETGKSGTRRAPIMATTAEPQASTEIARIVPCARYGSLQAFKGKDADWNAYSAGMWLVHNFYPADNVNKFKAREFCTQNFRDALSTGIPSAGGNLVPDVMQQAIIDLRERYGIFRQWAEVVPMSSDVQIFPRRSGSATPAWTSEGVAITASSASFDNVQLLAKKLGALTYISSELAEDAIVNIGDWVAMDFGRQFAYEEDRVGFTGTAIAADGNINGLFNKCTDSAFSASYIVVPTATHNSPSEIDVADLMAIMSALPQYARTGDCAWFCSQLYADAIFGRLKAAAGGNTIATLGGNFLGQGGNTSGIVGEYAGYPIVAAQVLPATSTFTNLPYVAFGNLRLAALIGERRQIRFATDASIKFAEDQIGIKATARMDINIHDLGSTTVCGPIAVGKGGSS